MRAVWYFSSTVSTTLFSGSALILLHACAIASLTFFNLVKARSCEPLGGGGRITEGKAACSGSTGRASKNPVGRKSRTSFVNLGCLQTQSGILIWRCAGNESSNKMPWGADRCYQGAPRNNTSLLPCPLLPGRHPVMLGLGTETDVVTRGATRAPTVTTPRLPLLPGRLRSATDPLLPGRHDPLLPGRRSRIKNRGAGGNNGPLLPQASRAAPRGV